MFTNIFIDIADETMLKSKLKSCKKQHSFIQRRMQKREKGTQKGTKPRQKTTNSL